MTERHSPHFSNPALKVGSIHKFLNDGVPHDIYMKIVATNMALHDVYVHYLNPGTGKFGHAFVQPDRIQVIPEEDQDKAQLIYDLQQENLHE